MAILDNTGATTDVGIRNNVRLKYYQKKKPIQRHSINIYSTL